MEGTRASTVDKQWSVHAGSFSVKSRERLTPAPTRVTPETLSSGSSDLEPQAGLVRPRLLTPQALSPGTLVGGAWPWPFSGCRTGSQLLPGALGLLHGCLSVLVPLCRTHVRI